jgi:hypothetical protein
LGPALFFGGLWLADVSCFSAVSCIEMATRLACCLLSTKWRVMMKEQKQKQRQKQQQRQVKSLFKFNNL